MGGLQVGELEAGVCPKPSQRAARTWNSPRLSGITSRGTDERRSIEYLHTCRGVRWASTVSTGASLNAAVRGAPWFDVCSVLVVRRPCVSHSACVTTPNKGQTETPPAASRTSQVTSSWLS